MPTLLKRKSSNSPGIISFTHNEALWGVPAKYPYVRELLNSKSKNKEWIFGVHIQGDCSFLKEWPKEEWQNFFLWPNNDEKYLKNVNPKNILPYTCVNFLTDFNAIQEKKEWDICIISRASSIKRIKETLLIVRNLLTINKDFKFLFIVPDTRILSEGNNTYKKNRIEKEFFELPLHLFNSQELRNITFISSSQKSFGKFPLQDHLISKLIAQSKFLFLYSHKEGVPRVIAEALLCGTPCIVSKNLKSGLNNLLNENNTLFINDELEIATDQINFALTNYEKYKIDLIKIKSFFSYNENIDKFKSDLCSFIENKNISFSDNWILEDLPRRLPCHGMKNNYQIMNNDLLFLEWFHKVDSLQNITDAYFDDIENFNDRESLNFRNYKFIIRKNISNISFIYNTRKFLLKHLKFN